MKRSNSIITVNFISILSCLTVKISTHISKGIFFDKAFFLLLLDLLVSTHKLSTKVSSITMYDTVVLGLGAVGSFALRALARKSSQNKNHSPASSSIRKILSIEQGPRRKNRSGSSHGYTRVYRKAYFEHANYVPWIEYSIKQFQLIEQASNKTLLEECGTLVLQYQKDAKDPLPPLCQASLQSAIKYNLPVEILQDEELKDRFPQFNYQKCRMVGVLDPSGGFLRSDEILDSVMDEVEQQQSIEILDGTTLETYEVKDNSVEIKLRKEGETFTVQSKTLLLAPGGWAGSLLPRWKPYLRPLRQVQGWVDTSHTSDPTLYDFENMPTWVAQSPFCPLPMYGIPTDPTEDPRRRYWLKACLHGRQVEIRDMKYNEPVCTEHELAETRLGASYVLSSSLNHPLEDLPRYSNAVPCIYTMTPDAHFLIGSPEERVFAVTGLSGHGFKMAPALGEMLASYAEHEDASSVVNQWNAHFCSPSRFL